MEMIDWWSFESVMVEKLISSGKKVNIFFKESGFNIQIETNGKEMNLTFITEFINHSESGVINQFI